MDPVTDHVDNVYWAEVDPLAENNSHALALAWVGSNKRVLELGPAAGHFTRALVANGCRVVAIERDALAATSLQPVAERVIVGDLSDPAVVASAIDDERFDVVLGGDVLEHLPDPLSVLQACRAALKPGGYVVLSLPNIAHADVKLQLLAGRFRYGDFGLLDRTHLHFFTLESIQELVDGAGLVMVDLQRVIVPVFGSEQAVEPASVSPALLAEVVADAESETYQFVLRAVAHDGDVEIANLANRVVELGTARDRERARRVATEAELESTRAALNQATTALEETTTALQEAIGHAVGFEAQCHEHAAHVAALQSTRSYRMLGPLRQLFGRR